MNATHVYNETWSGAAKTHWRRHTLCRVYYYNQKRVATLSYSFVCMGLLRKYTLAERKYEVFFKMKKDMKI